MKVHKTISVLMLVGLALVSFSSFAQEKTLHTEYDGFQWYLSYQNGKYGAQSMGGVTFIPLSRGYTEIYYISKREGGFFSVIKNNQGHGVCDITGREIIAPGRYDDASYEKTIEGCAFCWVELNGKSGVCDINGQEIIAPIYESLIYMDGEFRYENASGNWVSTGIKLSSLAQTSTAEPQPQPQPKQEPKEEPEPTLPTPPTPPRPLQPFQVWQQCGVCGGTGQCQSCLGTGHSLYGTDRCWNCGGNGKCTHCAGQGGHYVIEYH